jgi:hypothetical protein
MYRMLYLWEGEAIAVSWHITVIDPFGVNFARHVETSGLEESTTIVPPATLTIVGRAVHLYKK